MKTNHIEILHLEDEVMDAYLVRKILDRSHLDFNITVVSDKVSFVKEILNRPFDLILADHSLPQFTAMEALQFLKDRNVDTPFILLTGTVSEEFAVNAMREGAWDYILKDRLQRLPNAVITAIERYTTEKQRRKYVDELIAREALMKGAERLARFGSWQANMITGVNTWSDEMYRMLGYEPGSQVPSTELFLAGVHPEDFGRVKATYDYAYTHLPNLSFECRLAREDDSIMYVYSELEIKRNAFDEVVSLNGFIRDVTENREAKLKLAESERKYQYLFEHSPKPTWVIDAETSRFLDVNKAAVHHYGYSYDEFIAMRANDITVHTDGHNDAAWDNGTWAEKAMSLHRKKDGTVISVEQQTGSVVFEGRPARIILATEIK